MLPFIYMQYFVYILFSHKLNKYYIGSTANIRDRLLKHNRSKTGFTSTGKPWILMYHEAFGSRTEAMKRESQLKKWKNRDRIEALISNAGL